MSEKGEPRFRLAYLTGPACERIWTAYPVWREHPLAAVCERVNDRGDEQTVLIAPVYLAVPVLRVLEQHADWEWVSGSGSDARE